ncbi:putative Nudix hydrolase yfcD, partial [Reticulomyxa filosa]
NAYRELAEELGISGISLTNMGNFKFEDEQVRVWGNMFTCTYDGPITIQETEVESIHIQSIHQIFSDLKQGVLYTPDSIAGLKHLLIKQNKIINASNASKLKQPRQKNSSGTNLPITKDISFVFYKTKIFNRKFLLILAHHKNKGNILVFHRNFSHNFFAKNYVKNLPYT